METALESALGALRVLGNICSAIWTVKLGAVNHLTSITIAFYGLSRNLGIFRGKERFDWDPGDHRPVVGHVRDHDRAGARGVDYDPC